MQESCTIYFCPLRKKSGRKSHTFQVPNFPKLEESTLKTQHSWAIHPSLHRQPLHSFRQATELRMFQPTSRGFRRSKKSFPEVSVGREVVDTTKSVGFPTPSPNRMSKGGCFFHNLPVISCTRKSWEQANWNLSDFAIPSLFWRCKLLVFRARQVCL